MNRRRMHIVAGLLLLTLLLDCGWQSTPAATVIKPQTPVAHLPPEVRLRKLHLVRPDLIQYPIQYEVYC
jgi:hypothetical protein